MTATDHPQIKLLTRAEAEALPSNANMIGRLHCHGHGSLLKSQKAAMAWVRRVLPNWPGTWAIYQEFHYQTGASLGWAATELD
jgi:hypothetical protein